MNFYKILFNNCLSFFNGDLHSQKNNTFNLSSKTNQEVDKYLSDTMRVFSTHNKCKFYEKGALLFISVQWEPQTFCKAKKMKNTVSLSN